MSQNFKGPLMFMISSFLFGVMGLFVKLATPYVPSNEIAFGRFTGGILVTLALVRLGKVNISSNRRWLLITRGISGGLAIILLFAAMQTSTLTNVTVLNNTYPLFGTVIAAIYLREKVKKVLIMPLLVAMAGIFLLTPFSNAGVRLGDLLALASALIAGISVVVIRELRKTESSWVVFFYLSIFGAVFSGLLSVPDFVIPSTKGLGLVVLVAIFGTVGQIINTAAYKYCTVSVGSVLSMSTAVYSSILGVIFLGERLTFMELTGAVMVIAGSSIIAYLGSKQPEQKTMEPQVDESGMTLKN